MKLNQIFCGSPASLTEILDARSRRAGKQKILLNTPGARCLISFSLNIPGEIKCFPMAIRAFEKGLREIRASVSGQDLLSFEESRENTGPEAFFLLAADAPEIKRKMASIEENHGLGRLFDIDVLGPDSVPLSRSVLGLPPRSCLICGENAKVCARNRTHSMELVRWRTAQILNDYFKEQSADQAAAAAVRALLYEVSATPKPGLVDRNNSGSHQDMDFFTFVDSSSALIPWFRDFFSIGWEHGDETGDRLFDRLRFAGQNAEAKMFSATGGVNTHKGLIFASAILCGALGKVYKDAFLLGKKPPVPLDAVVGECKKLGSCSLKDFKAEDRRQDVSAGAGHRRSTEETAGERIHTAYGIAGARGEAALGFPSALTIGLPALKAWLAQGFSVNDAAVLTLLSLLSQVDDTNMIHRGGLTEAATGKKEAGALLAELTPGSFREKTAALDQSFIKRNLSPGGCADLLAVSLMICFLEESGMIA